MSSNVATRAKMLKLVGTMVHGKQEPGTRLCKVRFMGRHWVRVWAHVRHGFVEVASCLLFPRGGEWRSHESYVIA